VIRTPYGAVVEFLRF